MLYCDDCQKLNNQSSIYREPAMSEQEEQEEKPRRNWSEIIWIAVVVLGVGGGVSACVYSSVKEKREEKQAFWEKVEKEKAFCAPAFFSKKELVAHQLERVTCIDKEGQESYKFVDSNLVFGNAP